MESTVIVPQEVTPVKQNIYDLIDLAGHLDKSIKKDEETLNKYKEQIRTLSDGKHSGNKFVASISTPELTQIDPEKFHKLFEKGKITKKQYFSMLKVSSKASTLLDEKEFESISITFKGTPAISFKSM